MDNRLLQEMVDYDPRRSKTSTWILPRKAARIAERCYKNNHYNWYIAILKKYGKYQDDKTIASEMSLLAMEHLKNQQNDKQDIP
jgi:hypothetical protein